MLELLLCMVKDTRECTKNQKEKREKNYLRLLMKLGEELWSGRREERASVKEGERRQTHMCSFSQCNKLPSKIFPWHVPADSFRLLLNKAYVGHTTI